MIAVRPPEYFPRCEYMALVQHVDHFILADTFPYRRKSFQNRSKVRDAQGWHWITIPLFRTPVGAPALSVEIETGGRWQEKHWRSFLYNYRTTMYFSFLKDSFQPFFEQTWRRLGACTSRSVELLAELYGMRTSLQRASELDGRPDDIPGIIEAMDADVLTVVGDADQVPSTVDAEIQTVSYDPPTYHQNFEGFEPGMSAADLLFNYGREAQRLLTQGLTTAA
ncbi:MAG: WbqC family protein [Salinibacter sp.]|uniref:WbqC family protein n=1 Tax=Salinibacter sp. TaxID=2065818 RepID=UPI0035D441D4